MKVFDALPVCNPNIPPPYWKCGNSDDRDSIVANYHDFTMLFNLYYLIILLGIPVMFLNCFGRISKALHKAS